MVAFAAAGAGARTGRRPPADSTLTEPFPVPPIDPPAAGVSTHGTFIRLGFMLRLKLRLVAKEDWAKYFDEAAGGAVVAPTVCGEVVGRTAES